MPLCCEPPNPRFHVTVRIENNLKLVSGTFVLVPLPGCDFQNTAKDATVP